jgi:hypothetical protein
MPIFNRLIGTQMSNPAEGGDAIYGNTRCGSADIPTRKHTAS